MRAKNFIRSNIAYNKELCPKVWAGDHLRLEVRYRLLEIAQRFINYLDVPGFKLVDVLLRGSLTNYNYTDYSDFDLHLVTRFSDLECEDLAEALYQAKKKIWNDEHDITIHGHEVELYVEDIADENVSPGVYSVLDDQWIKQPSYDPPTINDRAVDSKVNDLIDIINSALDGDAEDVQRVREKISTMRKSGLARGGEYSVENLAFKILRNQGYLDKLAKAFNAKQDQELSIDEGIKKNTAIAALIAALSAGPAQADPNYPETQKQDPNIAQKALIILRSINKMKNYGQAGFEAEAQQEFNNIMRSIQGHPNQSRVYPVIKDIIQNQEQELPPLQEPVNERKKKKKRSKRGYPLGGYYGYYWGGTNYNDSDAGGDAGGGGDGGGESMYESEARLDPEVEEFLDGLTPDDVGKDTIGDYVVHYEGFTDQCQDTEEYQNNPEAVFDQVWSDFRKRAGKDPINYGIVGSEEYPIVYSVFRR